MCVFYDALVKTWVEQHQILAVAAGAAIAFVVWIAYPVFIILFVGYLLAAALKPVVGALNRIMPRVLAILVTYLVLLVFLAGASFEIAAPLSSQTGSFGAELSQDLGPGGPLSFVGGVGLNLQSFLLYLQQHAASLATSTVSFLAAAAATVVVSIYFLYDWRGMHDSLKGGGRFLRAFGEALRESEQVLGSWVHGQLLLSACVGALVFIATFLLGVPFAPVLGALAAVTEFIPYVGPILSAVPGVLFGLNQSLTQAFIVGGAYLLIHQLENHLLVPLIMRRSVNLHPVAVIAVMFAGFEVLGLVGIILAVPFTAFLRIVIPRLWYA